MKTIINKAINESILSSTNTGKKAAIENWCEKMHIQTTLPNFLNSYIDDDLVLHCNQLTVVNKQFTNISFKINVTKNAYFENCKDVVEMYLPINAKEIIIANCDNLTTIKTFEGSKCESLLIRNCKNLTDISGLSNLNITKFLYIENCPIDNTDIQLPMLKRIDFEECETIESVKGTFNNEAKIFFNKCNVKDVDIKGGNSLTITRSKKLKQLVFTNTSLKELIIRNCSKLKKIVIDGAKFDQIVIDDCNDLTEISCPDCIYSLVLKDLPALEKVHNEKITGAIITKNIPIQLSIKAKKIINYN